MSETSDASPTQEENQGTETSAQIEAASSSPSSSLNGCDYVKHDRILSATRSSEQSEKCDSMNSLKYFIQSMLIFY